MYSRSFYPEAEAKPLVPENYDGTAFTETIAPPQSEAQSTSVPAQDVEETSAYVADGGGIFASLSRTPFLSGVLGGIGKNLKFPTIGLEEILILATAAILFFSKEGDKECAIMLLLLLFIG